MKSDFYKIQYKGQEIFISVDDDMIEKSYKNNMFHEQDLLESINIDGGTVIDCGACVGNHSVYMSKFTNADIIYSFEPVLYNYTFLINNIIKNNCRNIIPLNMGLYDKEEFKKFELIKQKRWVQASLTGRGSIPVVSLDSFKFDNVSLIKIDVEGSEIQVIRGGIETISKFKPSIYVEALTDDCLKRIKEILGPLGYSLIKNCHKRNPTYFFKSLKE